MLKTNNIQEELKLISPAVANLPNNTPFAVPETYFENLSFRILKKVMNTPVSEDTPLSPLLESLKNQNPFAVPQGYFREFKADLPAEKTTVVHVFAWKKWASYAAAACIIGLVWTFLYLNYETAATEGVVSNNTPIPNQLISTESMQTYLNEVEELQNGNESNQEISADNNLLVEISPKLITEILKEIPENDISFFIEQSGGNEMVTLN